MQIKIKRQYLLSPTKMTTIKKLVTTNSGKDMEELEPSFIHLVRMKDGTVTSENNLAAPQKFKHRIII